MGCSPAFDNGVAAPGCADTLQASCHTYPKRLGNILVEPRSVSAGRSTSAFIRKAISSAKLHVASRVEAGGALDRQPSKQCLGSPSSMAQQTSQPVKAGRAPVLGPLFKSPVKAVGIVHVTGTREAREGSSGRWPLAVAGSAAVLQAYLTAHPFAVALTWSGVDLESGKWIGELLAGAGAMVEIALQSGQVP
jgi:hypothetical protein